MKQCQTLKHGRTSVPSVPSGDTFNGCSGSRWIYMDLPWFTDWIPHPKEVQDSPKRPWETHDQLCVIPVLCPTCSVQHSKPTGSLNIMSWQISWNSHITILVYYTITNIYIYIIYIYYTSLTTGASHQRPYHLYPCTATPGMRSLEISANVGTLSACEPRNLDSPVQNQGITRMWSVQYMNSIYISIQLNSCTYQFHSISKLITFKYQFILFYSTCSLQNLKWSVARWCWALCILTWEFARCTMTPQPKPTSERNCNTSMIYRL